MGMTFKPSWWKDTEYTSAFDRVKEALRRDWEQTKNDFTPGAPDLHQDVDDTVKQALGAQQIPPPGAPTPMSESEMKAADKKKGIVWGDVEGAVNYGYGASMAFSSQYPTWNDELEQKLKEDWSRAPSSPPWDDVKVEVRRGYHALRMV